MTDATNGDQETVHQRSGWLLPLAVFVVTALISGAVLYYYLGPRPSGFVRDTPSPTASTDLVQLSVNGTAFSIPANYLVYRRGQDGGVQNDISLYALWPGWKGFQPAQAQLFASNAPEARTIYMLLRIDRLNLTEEDRLERIYMGYFSNRLGVPGPYGLVQYSFTDDSGYKGEDLFVGETAQGIAVFRCVKFTADVPSPSCLRDMPLVPGVALSYRFKRAHLAQWQDISAGVQKLVQDFLATEPAARNAQ